MKKLIPIILLISAITLFNSCTAETEQTEDLPQDLQANIMQVHTYEIEAALVNDKISKNHEFHLIDVRSLEENQEAQIPHSELMTLDTLGEQIINNEDISFHDEIVVYCRSGNRSKTAFDLLTQLGYTNVKSMARGINKWTSLGYNTCSELDNTC